MEGYFDYYKLYLAGQYTPVEINMLTNMDAEPDHYPVEVYDLDGNDVGTAASKTAYVTLWNAIPTNSAIGILKGGQGPFSFVLELKPGQTVPAKVTGDPVHLFSGIFSNQFGSEFN
ncbi:hypothetical protein [Chitinophaga tropicalis]|uniref:Uncharacterized protein n=1 Tax=Chitinophaga tropicalis TaxID=2683588 RepID=A0A7K1UAR0_9BACT|nr:hypothetical protein [Chitinophaga tropicalis]MVT11386.1 hypothetical protein [Chitinophaga tropicalis]